VALAPGGRLLIAFARLGVAAEAVTVTTVTLANMPDITRGLMLDPTCGLVV